MLFTHRFHVILDAHEKNKKMQYDNKFIFKCSKLFNCFFQIKNIICNNILFEYCVGF